MEHRGNSGGGHYVSYVRCFSNYWYFCDDFFTPQRINAIGGLFTKKPSNFNTAEDFGTERNNTGIVIVSLVLVFLVVLTIFIVRRKRK